MPLPSLLSTLTLLSFLQTVWPVCNFSAATPLLLLFIVQYYLVDAAPPLRAHALKCATVGVFLQAVASAAVFLLIISIFLILVVLLFWTTMIQPNEYHYLIAAFQSAVRNVLAFRGTTHADMLISATLSLVSSGIHAVTALMLTTSYASLVVTPARAPHRGAAVRAVRVDDVLRYGWTGAIGMQTTKAIMHACMRWRWIFFWPIGVTLDPVFELLAVGVWQSWISLAVAQRDLLGLGNAASSVLIVCVLKTFLDFTSMQGLRGPKWEIAATVTGVVHVGSIALLCWRRYQSCVNKLR